MKKYDIRKVVFREKFCIHRLSPEDKYFISIYGRGWSYFRNHCLKHEIQSVAVLEKMTLEEFEITYAQETWRGTTKKMTNNAYDIYFSIFPERKKEVEKRFCKTCGQKLRGSA